MDTSVLKTGDVLYKTNSQDTYTVSKRATLIGVYNVNKGYADFKQINILYQNDEYSIVKANTTYGLNVYDYIVLDGSAVSDEPDHYQHPEDRQQQKQMHPRTIWWRQSQRIYRRKLFRQVQRRHRRNRRQRLPGKRRRIARNRKTVLNRRIPRKLKGDRKDGGQKWEQNRPYKV